jgi:FAD/FMN-containing dehydrogenase
VPVAKVPELLRRCGSDLAAAFPEAIVVPFGHVGDGNIHFNVVLPAALDAGQAAVRGKRIGKVIYDVALSLGGTFSAEHGIGRAKIDLLESRRDPIEVDLMRRVKCAIDSRGSLNPGRIFRPEPIQVRR